MKIHSGERPHKCEDCDKAFISRSALTRHRVKHTGKIGYWCEVCGKGFTRWSSLSTHKLVHTDERPYQCDECDRAFKYNVSLKEHREAHRKDKVWHPVYTGRARCNIRSTPKRHGVTSGLRTTHTERKRKKSNKCEHGQRKKWQMSKKNCASARLEWVLNLHFHWANAKVSMIIGR